MIKNKITEAAIVAGNTLFASIAWSGVRNILYKDGNWVWPVSSFFAWLVFLCLTWVMTKSKPIMFITLIMILVSFVLTFGLYEEYFIVTPLALLFFTLGSFQAMKEKESRLKISAVKIFHNGLPWFLTGICLIIAGAYYSSPLALRNENRIEIPRQLFDVMVDPAFAIVDGMVGTLPFTERFAFGGQVNETMQENLYQTINQVINRYSQPYKEYLGFGLAFGLFLGLRTISIPFMWLVILIGSLLFRSLLISGAVKKQERSVLQEYI